MQLQVHYFQYKAEQRLEGKNLVTVTVNVSHIKWEKPLRETKINGLLFDVKSYELNSNGTYKLTGVFDIEETEIENEMNDLLSHQSHDQNIFLREFLNFESIKPKQPSFSFEQFSFNSGLNNLFLSLHLPRNIQEVLTPPPEIS